MRSQASPVLPGLQVLILDKTHITDEGLRAIAGTAPYLKYLSLQVRQSAALLLIGPRRLTKADLVPYGAEMSVLRRIADRLRMRVSAL